MLTKIKDYLNTHPRLNIHTIGGFAFLFLMLMGIPLGLVANYSNTAIRPHAAESAPNTPPNTPPNTTSPTPTMPIIPSPTLKPTSAPTPTPVPPTCKGVTVQYNSVNTNQLTNVVTISGVSNANTVSISAWTTYNGKDDIDSYNAVNQGSGVWKATIDMNKHLLPGTPYPQVMNVQVYANNAAYLNRSCGATSFTINNPNLALNKTVTTSTGSYASQNIKMVDGNISTYWTIGTVPQWAEVNLGAAYNISHVRLRTGPGMSGSAQISIRSGAYTELYFSGTRTISPNTWYEFTFPAKSLQNLRIYNPVGSNGSLNVQWAEIEAYVK